MSDSHATSPVKDRRKLIKKKSRTADMSVVDHLREFRRRLMISLAAIVLGSIVGFIWYQVSFFGTPSLGELLRAPYCSLPPEDRASFSQDDACRLLATGPFDPFMLRLKVSGLVGLVLASPVWLGQLWGFITPGLLKNERRWSAIFVSIAVFLFVAGAVLAYFVVAFGLSFLLTIGDEASMAALTGDRYFNFLLTLLLVFGVSFEVPLIIGMLNVVGILNYEDIKDKRRVIIMVLFVFSAFMTPGGDPLSMLVLALALALLVEMAIQFCRVNDKRRAKNRPDWLDQDDSEVAPVTEPAPIDESTNVPVLKSSTSFKAESTDFGDVL